MTELEKLEAGLEYCYDDPEVEARKENALIQCKEYNAIDDTEKKFIELNGQTECSRLVAAHGVLRKSCNDYVGDAARLVGDFI